MMRPVVISFRKLYLPDIKRSDYDASGKDASGYEVSGFDATISKCMAVGILVQIVFKSLA